MPRRTERSTAGRDGRDRPTRLFASTMSGMRRLLAEEVDAADGLAVTDTGSDGRADVVLFDGTPPRSALSLRTAEDVFIEVGRTLRSDGDDPRWIARRVWKPARVRRALDVAAALGRRQHGRVTYRVVARLLQERAFLRTDLRRQFAATIRREQPDWTPADPAGTEVWVVEYRPGRIVAGIRVSDASMRQHGGRAKERAGALRPAVAAAMVRQAHVIKGAANLLDPCCGSGTILGEALQAGWSSVAGVDISAEAVGVARRNVPRAAIERGDARRLDAPDASVGAVVSNLPFGRQYTVDDPERWLADVLAEAARVTAPGGSVVLLVPEVPRSAVPASLRVQRRLPLRLLGTKTCLWTFERGT